MKSASLALTLLLFTGAGLPGGEDESRKRKDKSELRSLESRARRLSQSTPSDESASFFNAETQRLMKRSRSLPLASYELRRVMEALDDLLDAREDLIDARRSSSDNEDAAKYKREDTARRLERVYFRVQQGDYFGGLSRDASAREYIIRSRQLYQQARSAWDRKEYRQAAKLASASSELVNALENLAQAAVRKPDPPVLR